jgi:CheY-like chemotaxis protein
MRGLHSRARKLAAEVQVRAERRAGEPLGDVKEGDIIFSPQNGADDLTINQFRCQTAIRWILARESGDMSAGRPRVLVVDDERDCRAMLCEALCFEGYEVREAANGREALAVLGEWRPNLILLDLWMPEMGGRDFRAEQLGNGIADIPVLVVTAAVVPEPVTAELAAPMLSKPVDLYRLLEQVRRLLD